MRPSWKFILLTLICTILAPSLMLRLIQIPQMRGEIMPSETAVDPMEEERTECTITVLMSEGEVIEQQLDDYVSSVVLQEMPANFETEALKAQAVVARTYALRRKTEGNKHENAAVCINSDCCQGYCNQMDYIAKGGSSASIDKIRQAVSATEGKVLTYNGDLAEATYFSCSGGYTEDAKSVWGADIPYLQAVRSPGEEHAVHHTDTTTFSADEFRQLMGCDLPGLPGSWFGTITYTVGGGVATIEICGKSYMGTEIRQLLGLRSTAFVISPVGDRITITTRGFGHRVGMSQYGADAMAVTGSSYEDILSYYYKGTELSSIYN